jgi:hypothetical protein
MVDCTTTENRTEKNINLKKGVFNNSKKVTLIISDSFFNFESFELKDFFIGSIKSKIRKQIMPNKDINNKVDSSFKRP